MAIAPVYPYTPKTMGPGAPLDRQAARLQAIQDGWYDGEGHAPHPQRLSTLLDYLKEKCSEGCPIPHIYPTVEGETTAEWSTPTLEVSLSTSPEGTILGVLCKISGKYEETQDLSGLAKLLEP